MILRYKHSNCKGRIPDTLTLIVEFRKLYLSIFKKYISVYFSFFVVGIDGMSFVMFCVYGCFCVLYGCYVVWMALGYCGCCRGDDDQMRFQSLNGEVNDASQSPKGKRIL